MTLVATGPADLRDVEWLAEQVADLGRGIEAARAIWSNWFDGRQVGRFHPGMTAGEYIGSLGYRLTPLEGVEALPGASSNEVAAMTGVSGQRIRQLRAEQGASDLQPDRVTGADGKSYPRVVREVVAEIIEVEPDHEPEKEARTQRSRITVTEARQQVRILQGVLSMLRPDEVVPTAHDVVRELVPALVDWARLWSTETTDA